MKRPEVDIGECTLCGGCLDISPGVFRLNDASGFVEVADLPDYPQDEVDEAIKFCPMDCIVWMED